MMRLIAGAVLSVAMAAGAVAAGPNQRPTGPPPAATGSHAKPQPRSPARPAPAPSTAASPAPAPAAVKPIEPERSFAGPPSVPTGPHVTELVHVGSFKIPEGDFGSPQYHGFSFGGTALSYNAARNSLFMVGHDQDQLLAEVSIPEMNGVAKVLQPFIDPTVGRMSAVNPGDPNGMKIGGTLLWGPTLILSAFAYYDGASSQVLSHFIRSPILTDQRVAGPVRVGPLGAGFYSGYMGVVPPEWRDRLGGPALTGNGSINVISRTSAGPAVFAFDPANMTPSGASPLVYYPPAHQTLGRWGEAATAYYGGSDLIRGVAFVADKETVLFFGRHGQTFCYGPGVRDKNQPGCFDPTDDSKGVHGFPYTAYVWAYDANELAAVHARRKQPWDVRPYAVFALPGSGPQIGGATIDPASGRIYVTQMFGNRILPVVHVYTAK